MDRNRSLAHRCSARARVVTRIPLCPRRHPASVTTGGSAIAQGIIMGGEEERIAESRPARGGLVACGKGDETCWCFALPPGLLMPSAGIAGHCYCQLPAKAVDERTAAVSELAKSRWNAYPITAHRRGGAGLAL